MVLKASEEKQVNIVRNPQACIFLHLEISQDSCILSS